MTPGTASTTKLAEVVDIDITGGDRCNGASGVAGLDIDPLAAIATTIAEAFGVAPESAPAAPEQHEWSIDTEAG